MIYANDKDRQFYQKAAARNWRVRKTLAAFAPGTGRNLYVNRGTPLPHPAGLKIQANTTVDIGREPNQQEMIDAYNNAGGGQAGESAALELASAAANDVTSATITLGPGSSSHTKLHELGHVNQALEDPQAYVAQAAVARAATTTEDYEGSKSEQYANDYADAARKKEPDGPKEQ